MKNMASFHLKIVNFYSNKNCSIMHRCVNVIVCAVYNTMYIFVCPISATLYDLPGGKLHKNQNIQGVD